MSLLRGTLVADGPGDRALVPLLEWLLRQHSRRLFQVRWADLGRLRVPPRSLQERIAKALGLYPCEILFVHRDAERAAHATRVSEIRRALPGSTPTVCVVPVRMTEAWLLFDEPALRSAAGCPRGTRRLELPPLEGMERIANPKVRLRDALAVASGLGRRRRQTLNLAQRTHRLATLIADYAPLRVLPAFRALETEVRDVVSTNGWSE